MCFLISKCCTIDLRNEKGSVPQKTLNLVVLKHSCKFKYCIYICLGIWNLSMSETVYVMIRHF